MQLSVLLYGRQPLAGYQQGSGRREDDDTTALDGAGTRTHRFVIRLSKLAAVLCREQDFLTAGPLPILDLMPQLLQTNSQWKPYQAQLVLKRFLLFRYARNMHSMHWAEVSSIRLSGPGTIFWFRKLTPAAFSFLDRMHHEGDVEDSDDDPSDDDEPIVTKTMVNSARQGEKTWSNVVIDCLLIHQDHMLLHKKTNELFGQRPFDWDDFQNVVCEVRGFVYKPRPRRKSTGFLADMRREHWKWHLEVALPMCWAATTCERDCSAKRVKTS